MSRNVSYPLERPRFLWWMRVGLRMTEKKYLVCYPIFKKETSCKEIRISSTKLKF